MNAMKMFTALLVALLLSLHYALWLGDKNVFDWLALQRAIAQTQTEIQTLKHANDQLLAEVIDLKEGGQTVETLARSQYGLIKPNETFYQVIE